MARKTKKQKKSAEKRHLTDSSPKKLQYSITDLPSSRKTHIISKPSKAQPVQHTSYIYCDIRKTITITSVLLFIEFFIFWIVERGGSRYLQGFIG